MPNFSVERMAAAGTCLQIRALGARRHRSPLRSAGPHMQAGSLVSGTRQNIFSSKASKRTGPESVSPGTKFNRS